MLASLLPHGRDAPTAEVHSAPTGRQAASARPPPRPAGSDAAPRVPLLVALAYGAFFHGAAQIPDENRLEVALAVGVRRVVALPRGAVGRVAQALGGAKAASGGLVSLTVSPRLAA
jgi:hypothetical protein